jgi:hypothetical protein
MAYSDLEVIMSVKYLWYRSQVSKISIFEVNFDLNLQELSNLGGSR